MARRRYKSYKKRPSRSRGRSRGGKKPYMRWIILLLVVITAGVIISKQLGKDTEKENGSSRESDLEKYRNLVDGGDGTTDGSVGDGGSPGGGGGDRVLPPEGTGITSETANSMIAAATKDMGTGKVIDARNKFNRVLLEMTLSSKDRAYVKRKLTELSEQWLFGKQVFEGDTLTGTYEVKDNDYLSTIAPKYKVPYEALMMVNGIRDAKRLQKGKIKVVKGPFRVEIQLSKFNMDLYLQDQYVKSYKVGIGKPGEETPTGKWRLKSAGKSDKGPSWPHPVTGKMIVADDPEYPLGARWIPIECIEGEGVGRTGFALHGTKEPESIGTKCSLGCIRLKDENVIEVYNLLAAGISKVDIYE